MKTELLKAKEKIRQQENELSSIEKEKKGLQLKLKETESLLEKRPQTSETSKTILELQTKLKFFEAKCSKLEHENDKLHNNVQGSILQNSISAKKNLDKFSPSHTYVLWTNFHQKIQNLLWVLINNNGFEAILKPYTVIITNLNLTKLHRFYP
jgi:hypothetical protein